MVRKRAREAMQELNHQLNWPIRLRELSIRLQDKSYKMAQEAIKLYVDGSLSRDAVMEIIRLSGVSLSRYVNPRKYLLYDGDTEVINETEDVIIDDEEVVDDYVREVEEEYVGQGVIRRLMGHD
ncbi:hypothetical protein [Vulcanisaeta sp. JCM 14467]|uniref:hypothetical protein n=1 Tax=Vulcanisaeta sp. JCM 14467 TaxID=1295370 RepID=UPI0006D1A59C|nr:hypothetical protein [Vulcanisaeta sp. JCM 14467]